MVYYGIHVTFSSCPFGDSWIQRHSFSMLLDEMIYQVNFFLFPTECALFLPGVFKIHLYFCIKFVIWSYLLLCIIYFVLKNITLWGSTPGDNLVGYVVLSIESRTSYLEGMYSPLKPSSPILLDHPGILGTNTFDLFHWLPNCNVNVLVRFWLGAYELSCLVISLGFLVFKINLDYPFI